MGKPAISCILVVEDDPDSLHAMMRLLMENGYSAYGASTYRSAVDAFERERCPVMICDIMLPDGSGLDLMRELAPHGVRGIAISGLATSEDKAASLAAGFTAHIAK